MTSSKTHVRSYASCKSDTVICSRLLCVGISCQILVRYETSTRSCGRLSRLRPTKIDPCGWTVRFFFRKVLELAYEECEVKLSSKSDSVRLPSYWPPCWLTAPFNQHGGRNITFVKFEKRNCHNFAKVNSRQPKLASGLIRMCSFQFWDQKCIICYLKSSVAFQCIPKIFPHRVNNPGSFFRSTIQPFYIVVARKLDEFDRGRARSSSPAKLQSTAILAAVTITRKARKRLWPYSALVWSCSKI